MTDVQHLIKTAPAGMSAQILTPMKNLADYAVRAAYSENDYKAIFEGTADVINSINA